MKKTKAYKTKPAMKKALSQLRGLNENVFDASLKKSWANADKSAHMLTMIIIMEDLISL